MKRQRLLVHAILIASLVVLLAGPLSASAAPTETAGGSGCSQFYTVRHGDNLFRIALRFHTTVRYLMNLNGLSSANHIVSGTTLCVCAAAPRPHNGFWYRVRYGETLYRIATRYGWSASYLARVNGISNPSRIYGGQLLFIPDHA